MKILLRKIIVALTPNWMNLKSNLIDGSIIVAKNSPGYGGRGIYIFRDDLEKEFGCLKHLLKNGDVAIDGGANVGCYTIQMARLVGEEGCVIAIEPFPESAAVNLRNILRNNLRNVRLRLCALSDKSGHSSFYMKANSPNSFTLIDDGSSPSFNSRVITIDDLVEQENLSKLDFIKLDVEGFENEALAGARDSIKKYRPIIIAENNITSVQSSVDNFPDYDAAQIIGSQNIILFPKEKTLIKELTEKGYRIERVKI